MAKFKYIPNRVIDTNGISDGASIAVYQSGTTTPVSIYSEEELTTPLPNPLPVVAGAPVPAFYFDGPASGVRVKVTDASGATVDDDDPYNPPANANDLASTDTDKGAALIKFESGDTVADLRDPTKGADLVAFQQSGTGTVERTVGAKAGDIVNVLDFIPVAEHAAILAGTSTYDASADTQAAIDAVNNLKGGTLIVRGRVFLGASANIDRPVDTTTGDLVIMGIGNGAGFSVASAMTMFSSTIGYTSGPVSERVVFQNLTFSCDDQDTAAYVLAEQFLRVEFNFCRYERIKCNNSTIYMQSWRWVNCNVWRWSGSFSKTTQQAYDCHASMTKLEGATVGGDAWDWKLPQGCSVHQGMFEGATGCHVRATGCNGLSIAGNYTENGNATNPDYIFALQSAGGVSKGVSFVGNHINTQNSDSSFYPVILGKTTGMGGGNYSNRNLYDDTDVKTGDFTSCGDNVGSRLQKSNISLSALPAGIKTRATGIVAHAGGGQADATLLSAQVNVISTVATTADSVILPAITGDSAKCLEVYVLNNGANAANVFPPSGQNFEFTAANTAKSLAGSGASKIYRYLGAGVWTQA